LTDKQTPMALIAMGQALNPKITIVLGEHQPQESATIVLNQIHRKVQPHLKDERISFDLEIEATGLILENTTRQSFEHTMMISLEKHANALLDKEIQAVIQETFQKHRADIYGFSTALIRKYPEEWNKIKYRWRDLLPEVEVRVRTKVHLENSGELIDSLGIKEGLLKND
jgi:spore germination protein KC